MLSFNTSCPNVASRPPIPSPHVALRTQARGFPPAAGIFIDNAASALLNGFPTGL